MNVNKKVSVVTPDRFKQGLSYKEFLDQVKVNKDRFEQYYQTAKDALTPQDVRFFKEARDKGAVRILVLGEDWCPDVYRGMPVIARIAEASGMELRVFPRDANLDIMNEFLNQGQFQSIPTVVFYTSNQEYLCHWIERPKQAHDEMAQINEGIQQEMAGKDENEIRQARRDRTNARFPAWQSATVKEIRDMLSAKVRTQ
ncbi:MAG: thioredoxin family protein [Chloroflexi bacterium]|nr:thioredoxin family protein [Chloroflexota bacterium]